MNRVWRIPATALLAVLTAGTASAQRIAGSRSIALPAGAPPARVTVTGTPALARVSWVSVGASSYLVERWMRDNPDVRASSPPLRESHTAWDDPLPLPGTYIYRVTATYADGSQGFVDVSYVRPEPTNPAVLTATLANPANPYGTTCFQSGWGHTCSYTVATRLTWTEVSGAAYYVVYGPAVLPTTGLQTNQTSVVVTSNATSKIQWGMNTWTVAAFFLPGPIGTAPANYTKGSLNIPSPTAPKP